MKWESLLVLAIGLPLLFFTLSRSGLLVVKSCSCLYGAVMGTVTRFWGEYQNMCCYVSKNFRISPKYTALIVRLEISSGSVDLEVLGPNGSALYEWYICGSFVKEIECKDIKACKIRITSSGFSGKFDISMQ